MHVRHHTHVEMVWTTGGATASTYQTASWQPHLCNADSSLDLQGTKVEGTIGRLFEGHMHMFIECINVDYKSTRRESFMDLQLDVKGCANIYNSFDKYCEVEVMDGQNQYQTDEHGMQVSRHGCHTLQPTYLPLCDRD